MTQVFQPDGTMVAVSVVQITPNTVTRLRTAERDGYTAVQLGAGERRKLTKPVAGQLKDLPRVATIREFRLDSADDYEVGQQITVADVFAEGDLVDVTGVSKGKGFAGTVKRHNFSRGPKTHGSDNYRKPGSIGPGTTPGRVYKGLQDGRPHGPRAGHDQEAARRPRRRRAEPDPRQGIGPRRAAARSPSCGRPDDAADHPLRPNRRDRRERRPRRGAVRGAGERGRPPPGRRRPARRSPDRHRATPRPAARSAAAARSRIARRAPAARARARAPRRTTAAAASCSARTRARYEQKLPQARCAAWRCARALTREVRRRRDPRRRPVRRCRCRAQDQGVRRHPRRARRRRRPRPRVLVVAPDAGRAALALRGEPAVGDRASAPTRSTSSTCSMRTPSSSSSRPSVARMEEVHA